MIIIPARLESSRLNNKLLLPLNDIPIIIHVARIAQKIDSCIVACDSKEILEVCKNYKIDSVLTKKTHQSGTDRCAEVAQTMGFGDNEVIINLQGDEPFIEIEVIEKLKNAMSAEISKNGAFMASCCKKIPDSEANDPNLVKVALDSKNFALYFSRAKIPYHRDSNADSYFGHIGIYAFSAKSLKEFCALKKSPLEQIEKLEQLRALWHGKKILMVEVNSESIGIDTMDDYNRAKILIKEKHGNSRN